LYFQQVKNEIIRVNFTLCKNDIDDQLDIDNGQYHLLFL